MPRYKTSIVKTHKNPLGFIPKHWDNKDTHYTCIPIYKLNKWEDTDTRTLSRFLELGETGKLSILFNHTECWSIKTALWKLNKLGTNPGYKHIIMAINFPQQEGVIIYSSVEQDSVQLKSVDNGWKYLFTKRYNLVIPSDNCYTWSKELIDEYLRYIKNPKELPSYMDICKKHQEVFSKCSHKALKHYQELTQERDELTKDRDLYLSNGLAGMYEKHLSSIETLSQIALKRIDVIKKLESEYNYSKSKIESLVNLKSKIDNRNKRIFNLTREAQELGNELLNLDSSIRLQQGLRDELLKIAEVTLEISSEEPLTDLGYALEKNKNQLELILEDVKLILGPREELI